MVEDSDNFYTRLNRGSYLPACEEMILRLITLLWLRMIWRVLGTLECKANERRLSSCLLVGVFLKIRCVHYEIQNVTGGRQWSPLVSTPVGKCEKYATLFCCLVHRL